MHTTSIDVPLVLTLWLDKPSFQFFDELRQAHFPAERNYLKAHLTLFHHLPGEYWPAIAKKLEEVSRQIAPFTLQAESVKMIGRGVAYTLNSTALKALHEKLRQQWLPWLTPQDQQRIWPHITVQNKVTPAEAHAVQQQLSEDFSSFAVTGKGLQVWRYEGGPWSLLHEFPFNA